ncbi:MAG: hypothetical protein ABH803_04015 [Candidatus Micrarchaeota archaeon]
MEIFYTILQAATIALALTFLLLIVYTTFFVTFSTISLLRCINKLPEFNSEGPNKLNNKIKKTSLLVSTPFKLLLAITFSVFPWWAYYSTLNNPPGTEYMFPPIFLVVAGVMFSALTIAGFVTGFKSRVELVTKTSFEKVIQVQGKGVMGITSLAFPEETWEYKLVEKSKITGRIIGYTFSVMAVIATILIVILS